MTAAFLAARRYLSASTLVNTDIAALVAVDRDETDAEIDRLDDLCGEAREALDRVQRAIAERQKRRPTDTPRAEMPKSYELPSRHPRMPSRDRRGVSSNPPRPA